MKDIPCVDSCLLRLGFLCHHAQPVKTTTRAIVLKIFDSANSDFEVSIKEALHIKHRNPNLNKQLSTQGMSFMLKIFT